MRLKNCGTCCELRSENAIEAQALLAASMRSYSPRSAGIMPNDDRCLILIPEEAQEFAAGVLRDVAISNRDKWAISKLLSCWCSGEIKDEGATL